jgi:hypothetical protein
MTLRDTELIGRRLVKYGFFRSNNNHHNYECLRRHARTGIGIKFIKYGSIWVADFLYHIDHCTMVKFNHHEAVFTPEWVIEEHDKLLAMFKFIRA